METTKSIKIISDNTYSKFLMDYINKCDLATVMSLDDIVCNNPNGITANILDTEYSKLNDKYSKLVKSNNDTLKTLGYQLKPFMDKINSGVYFKAKYNYLLSMHINFLLDYGRTEIMG